MARTHATRAELSAALRGALRPPVREGRFWVIQLMVVVIAGAHLVLDAHGGFDNEAVPGFISVALLLVPVGYAAVRYGLAGSAATALWATLLWIPDLTIRPFDRHLLGDVANLVLVDLVAFVFGRSIEAERLAHLRLEEATAERLRAEARFRRLFETNSAPILVLSERGIVRAANPAAEDIFGALLIGRPGAELLDDRRQLTERAGELVSLANGHDYRIDVAVDASASEAMVQVIFEDVTAERRAGRRAERYAQLVVQAEEEQRLHLARELHDEPLQLFLHLARQLQHLSEVRGVPERVASGLAAARGQALEAAGRLRTLARDLRPPALDQLGLVAALSSLVADVEEETPLHCDLAVHGEEVRLARDIELAAFRIVQESVRNCLKHARASAVRVEVAYAPEALRLSIVDDGRGFEPAAIDELRTDHFGLLGMSERARVLGGELSVHSTPGCGTHVEVTVPLAGPDEASRPISAPQGSGEAAPAARAS
ncbi:MAG: ATP-binding protein [Actinomycetota bacterium]|nr:ATP-binding protein [Actinomycetota bacterium]